MTDAGTTTTTAALPEVRKDRPRSLWSDAWHQLRRNPVFIIAALVVLAVVSMALFPSLWTSQDPSTAGFNDLTQARQRPGGGHIFGTSLQGGDLYTLLIYGARPSLIVGTLGAVGCLLIGGTFGTLAGYFGGWTDIMISRFTDIILGLPFILGAIVMLSLFRSRSVWVVAFVIMALGWTTLTRIMRGAVIQAKAMDYVEAARAVGAKNSWIIVRHILPNAVAPVIVYFTIIIGVFVGLEATLTFLGIGLQPPTPSWGIQISEADQDALNGYPHLLIFPCGILVMTVLSFILLGDALRDALDPKTR
jgi:oligopeptide transport system permease protein